MDRGFRLEPAANTHLDAIYDYTAEHWGEEQAVAYILGLFDEFALIADRRVVWRSMPFELGIDGFVRRWRHHVIYWKQEDAAIAIVAIFTSACTRRRSYVKRSRAYPDRRRSA